MDLDKGSSPPSSSAALAEAVVAREAVQSDGSVEFFINYLGQMKIKPENAKRYAEALAAQDYDLELFAELTCEELKELGFSGADVKRGDKFHQTDSISPGGTGSSRVGASPQNTSPQNTGTAEASPVRAGGSS
eukprot:COSAG06_NODE_35287_length_462_cov_0.531680_1_plen_132_part_10